MPASTILVADDDRAIRTVLNQALIRLGHDVRTTGNAATLWRWVADGQGDLVITDVVMPDENGLDLIPRIKKIRPELRVIVMSAQNTLMTALTAAEKGAYEYLPKPFDLSEVVSVVSRALSAPGRKPQRGPETAEGEELPLIGRSPAMQEIYRALAIKEGRPEKVLDKIVEGRMQKYWQETCLLEQPYVRDDQKTVGELVKEARAELGENIVIRRFARFQLGEELA